MFFRDEETTLSEPAFRRMDLSNAAAVVALNEDSVAVTSPMDLGRFRQLCDPTLRSNSAIQLSDPTQRSNSAIQWRFN
jgi:hypothetical protein